MYPFRSFDILVYNMDLLKGMMNPIFYYKGRDGLQEETFPLTTNIPLRTVRLCCGEACP